MKKTVLAIGMLMSMGATAETNGYTFAYMQDCAIQSQERVGSHCFAFVSPVYYARDVRPTMSNKEDNAESWWDDIKTEFSDVSMWWNYGFSVVFPKDSERDARQERNQKIRDWKRRDYKIFYRDI